MELTMQQEQALGVARLLAKAGVPMFLAQEDPYSPLGHKLPFGWETNEPSTDIVDAWRPGFALCAVTGHVFDLIDVDPRSGGSEQALGATMPHIYLTAETPSGGRHHFIKTLGVSSLDGKVAQGIDIKSGQEDGSGRGFAFIAPTLRRSKVDGQLGEYRWVLGPKGPVLPTPDQLAADGSGGMLRARVMELRRSSSSTVARRISSSSAEREWESALRRLAADVAHWRREGWGGAAHTGILAATTHLARLNPERAHAGFEWAFAQAGAVPDGADWQKLQSAIDRAVPDVIVPDAELSAAEAFFMGGDQPPAMQPGGSLPALGGAVSLPGALPGSAGVTPAPGEGGVRRRFQPMSRAEAASIVPPDSLIDGLLLTDTKARISGASGTGKTWVVLDMAAHVAAGMAWQGREVRKSKVLYVAGEGAPSFDQRLKAWEEKHGRAADIDLVPDAVQVANHDWEEFVLEIADADYGLFIFDTQGSMTLGLEENSNKDANAALARLDILRRLTRACVLLVHHTGHEEQGRARGASAWNGGLDTELLLSGTVKQELTLKPVKQKYVELGKSLRMRMERVGVGLVVAPRTAVAGAEGFFSEQADTEHQVKVAGVVKRIQDYYAAGGTAKATVRSLTQVLRVELNVRVKDDVIREACRTYTAGIGMPVDMTSDD